MEAKHAPKPKEIKGKEQSSMDEAIAIATYLVVENIPPVSLLKEMENGETKDLLIGERNWTLQVDDDVWTTPSGQKEKIKHILLRSKQDKDFQVGITTDGNFDLVVGSVLGGMPIRITEPFRLDEFIEELKIDNQRRIEESMSRTNDISKTAIELNLRPDYVSSLIPASPLKK